MWTVNNGRRKAAYVRYLISEKNNSPPEGNHPP